MKAWALIFLLLLVSCKSEKSPLILFERNEASYKKFLNQGPTPTAPNLSIIKTIKNDDYPIEIALYDDGKFYYNLPNLGDGFGTWKYSEGTLKLNAPRKILTFDVDMAYEFLTMNAEGTATQLKFRDRFGNKALNLVFSE